MDSLIYCYLEIFPSFFFVPLLGGHLLSFLKGVFISSAIRLPPTGHKQTLAGFHVRSEEAAAKKAS